MMNERIRELALQAWYYADDNSRDPIGSHGGLYRDKFAELIVRECMKETMDEMIPDEDIAHENDPLIREYLKGKNQAIVDVVIRFRNHFGVKK